jgi:hypothetical protein
LPASAVCVSPRTGITRTVPITRDQIQGPGALDKGSPCP